MAWEAWASGFPQVKPLPAKAGYIALYLISLLQGGKSFHVVKGAAYGIKWKHAMEGYSDPTNVVCAHIVEAAKRVAKPKRKAKEPFTVEHLGKMYENIGLDKSSLLHMRNFTLLLLSFAGFLRFDEAVNLKRGDVTFFKTHMSIFLEGSKTDVYRDGHTVLVSKVVSNICPVTILRAYFRRAGLSDKPDEFIFRGTTWVKTKGVHILRTKNAHISYSTARTGCLDLVRKIGLDPKKFGLHSARSGGATSVANRGVPDRLFKRHGRWKSDRAKDGYIKDSLSRLLSVTRSLGL